MSNWGLRRTGVLEETTPHVFKDMLYFVYTDDVPAGWHGRRANVGEKWDRAFQILNV